jgi:DNA-binding NarL/FixJ family response regulator
MVNPVRVFVVSPKNLISDLLIAGFQQGEEIKVIGVATSAQSAREVIEGHTFDVALIAGDLQDPAGNPLEVLRSMRELAPSVRSVVLLGQRDPETVVECFRAGARGVFSESTPEFRLLCKCVLCVHAGQIWASSEELTWVVEALESIKKQSTLRRVVNAQGVNLLSKREEDVVQQLMEGLSNREIALNLKLSEHTIKNYLFRIFDKLGVSSRTELLLYSINSRRAVDPTDAERKPSLLAG